MKKHNKITWAVLAGATILSLTVVLVAGRGNPNPVLATPKITWSEKEVEVIRSPGEGEARSLVFSSTQDLENVVIEPVPEIAPFVSVEPEFFAFVPANEPQAVRLVFSIPDDAEFDTFEGTVHVRSGNRTVPQTLKVIINVWPSFVEETVGFVVKYPPDWSLFPEDSPKLRLYSPKSVSAISQGDLLTPADITLTLIKNAPGLSLSTFVRNYRNGWFQNYKAKSSTMINGHEVFRADDSGALIPKVPGLGAFISIDDSVLLITGHEDTRLEFERVFNHINFFLRG